jgi:hypothetical protein
MPKKCGHMSGKAVIPAEEMVGKLRAAVATPQSASPWCCSPGFTEFTDLIGLEEINQFEQQFQT